MSHSHNHDHCIQNALKEAEDICKNRGLRFTNIRRQVLELIWSDHKPAKAYDLLEKIKVTQPNAKPPTVYRALDFLSEHGLIHTLPSLNAYIGCPHPREKHIGFFFICEKCSDVTEMKSDHLHEAINRETNDRHLSVQSVNLEMTGLCEACNAHE